MQMHLKSPVLVFIRVGGGDMVIGIVAVVIA